MNKNKIKNCTILYNPVSTGFEEDSINKIAKTVKKECGITPNFEKSMYEGHLIELIKESDARNTLLITLGGDGTVSEAYKAFNEINQKGIYAHVPTGTTNDMAKNYDVRYKDADKIVEDILRGEITKVDSFTVNGKAACYSSVFGHLAHVPYITNPSLKKNLGHAGYVVAALPDLMKKPVKYNISYETDNLKGNTICTLGAVSNSKGFAGITLYPNAKLDDGKLELLLVKDISPSLIARLVKDYFKDDIDLRRYEEHIITDVTSKIDIAFEEPYLRYPIDNDGENSKILPTYKDNKVTFEIGKPITLMKRRP